MNQTLRTRQVEAGRPSSSMPEPTTKSTPKDVCALRQISDAVKKVRASGDKMRFLKLMRDLSDVDAKYNGETALMMVCRECLPFEAVVLLERGANVNETDSKGKSALDHARKSKHDGPLKRDLIGDLENRGALSGEELLRQFG